MLTALSLNDMLSIKRWVKFWWILPGVYLLALLIQLVGLIGGAGHSPRSLEFLFCVVAWPSYLLNLRIGERYPLLNLVLFLVVGLLTYGLLGFLLDMIIARYRHRRK
jgi:hypothetical protein